MRNDRARNVRLHRNGVWGGKPPALAVGRQSPTRAGGPIYAPLLVGDVLPDHLQRSTANRRNEVAVGPERWEPRPKGLELLAQEPGRPAFDLFGEPMNPELGVDSHQEVDVVGHGT